MARAVRDAKLDSRSARAKLEARGEPYYRSLGPGLHLGYRKGKTGGRWVMRWRTADDKYHVETIGMADDMTDADGRTVLDLAQAQAAAWSNKVSLAQVPLSLSEIRSLPQPTIGIYFLFLGTTLQYVGQTINVFDRVKQHQRQSEIVFDAWYFLPAKVDDLGVLEEVYIRAYRPPHNRGLRRRQANSRQA
jgi:hypothetical protein